MSVLPLSDNPHEYAQGWEMDHRTPMEDRWGGWYVTGTQVPAKHLGNVPVLHVPTSYVRANTAPSLATASGAFDTSAYLTPHSDVVALMVLNHQTRMSNLLTRLGWQARIALHGGCETRRVTAGSSRHGVRACRLHVVRGRGANGVSREGRVRLYSRISVKGPARQEGTFAARPGFTRRLLRYPCSYMIYNDAFDALPSAAKGLVYERMWGICQVRSKTGITRSSRPMTAAPS